MNRLPTPLERLQQRVGQKGLEMQLLPRQAERLPEVTHRRGQRRPQDLGGSSWATVLPDGPLVPWSALQTQEYRVVLDPRMVTHVTLE